MIKKVLFLISILFLITSVNGLMNISINKTTENSISWNWSEDYKLTDISIDGYKVMLFDYNSSRFDLTGLNPNERHSIKIYMGIDNVTNVTTTTINQTKYNIDMYILFLLGLICLIIGAFVEKIISLGGVVFGCLGILTALDNSFTMGVLFALIIIASFFVAFEGFK